MSLGKRLIGTSGASSGPGTEEVVDIFEDNSCKALYTFNYDASDLGGNYSLTEYNSSNNVWGAGGKFNTGYRIKDNSNGYLGITSHGFNYPNTAVSFWFYADKAYGEAYSTARTIFTFQNGTSTRKAYIGVSYNSSEGNWYGFINARSGLYGSTSTTVAFSGVIGGSELDNTWVHIVGQTGSDLVESRRNSFYVNGSLWTGMTYSTGSSTSSGGFHSPVPYRFYVGYYYSGNIQYAPAYPIDQLRIFNKKVTAAEASTLYNESVGTVQSTTDVVYFPTSALDTNLETQEVARYLLNDDVTDDLGNYNGTATSITYTNGKYGKSAVFNGSSSKITTGYTDNPSAFSVSGWIKHTSSTFTGKYHYLAGKGYYTNSSTNNYWQLVNYSSSYPEFRVRSGGTSVAATSSVAMTLNYWHHLVGTCDSAGNLKIYLDGALVGSASGAPSRSMGQGMIIGSYLDGTTYFHEGEIDQVRVFDYALGQEAVNSLYNDSDTPVIIDKAPETAFYKLNGNAYDSAGGFDGTASNITYTNGLFGQAAVFNGTNAQIETTATLIPNSTDFSLSFWVKPENQFGSILARGLVTTASYAYGFDVSFNNSANKLRFFRHTGGAYANEHYAETATNSITVGVWQHIALSFDKSTGTPQFYIDGSAVTTNIVTYAGGTGSAMATGNISFNSSYDGGLYRLGNRSNGGLSTSRLKGSLDHFRVFNKVISASEVATLYSDATDIAQVLGDTSCTAFYNFNNNAYDLAGSNNPSSVSNIIYKYDGISTNVDFGVGGKSLYGARFNGNTSIINTNYVLPADSTMSFSFWAKFDAVDNGSQRDFFGNVAVNGSGSNVNNRLVFRLRNDNNFSINIGNGSNYWSNNTVANATPYYNQWTFLCVTLNGTSVKVYINNSIVSLTSSVAFGTAGVLPLFIGEWGQGFGSKRYKGSIDQFRIFNKELSASEVSKLYGNGAGEIACEYTATTTDIAYPIANAAYYKLDNNSKSETPSTHYLFIGDAGNSSSSGRLNSVDAEFTYTRPAGYSEWGGSWDPSNKAGSATQTFEESNKKWTKSGTYYNGVWSTNKYHSGKYYAEIEFLGVELIYGISRLTTATGYSTSLQNNSIYYGSWATHSWKYSTTNTAEGVILSTNDVIGLAADFDNKILQVYRNNVLFDTVSIAAPDGTDTNVQYRFGRYGQAAVFNGSNSKIVLPNLSLGLNDPSNFSFSCWFKTNSSTQDNQGIIWLNGSNAGARFGVGINSTSQGGDTSVYFGVGTSSFTYINSGTGAFVANKWAHIVAIKSSITGMSLYVDNVLKATNPGATGAANVTATGGHRIGAYKTTAESSYFNGYIDQIRIFSSALSSSQVTELYNEKPEVDTSNFKTVLYEGTGATQYISNVGMDLETNGGLLWIKNRDAAYNNVLYDHVRNSFLYSNLANSQDTNTAISFEKNGFITSSTASAQNANNNSYVAWNWKSGGDAVAGTGTGVTNVSISTNTEAGFSIVKYTGGNSASDTVNHGLTDAEMIILKDLDDGSNNWRVWHKDLTTNYWLYLNLTNAQASAATDGGIRNVDSNNFGFINGTTAGVEGVNSSASNYIAYVWKSIAGYSSIGSYEGNGTTATTTITTGFKPSWVMIKRIDSANSWRIFDTRRDTTPLNLILDADTNNAESNGGTTTSINITSTGFNMNTSQFGGSINTDGGQYLYMAFK